MATAARESFHRLQANKHVAAGLKAKNHHDLPASIPADPSMESVYRLIPEVYVQPPKEKMYKSKYADQARQEYINKQKAVSMGPAKVILPAKTEFLKRGQGVAKVTGFCF